MGEALEGELRELVEAIPRGWTSVVIDGRRWAVTRTIQAGGRTTSVKAERLDDSELVSANVWSTSAGYVLKPCEMPAEKVLGFLRKARTAYAAE
ncbi:peptide methionine sulfoxide reductase [Cumulibacter soli]|uniref:peptide methionine sulfoxide reductase n=1 Tax=Cumulibacter soli TaxID=2546344 RepID=UPI001067261E|nr:peptide methionine sulfoxide reductase [Cumulibacter soli]